MPDDCLPGLPSAERRACIDVGFWAMTWVLRILDETIRNQGLTIASHSNMIACMSSAVCERPCAHTLMHCICFKLLQASDAANQTCICFNSELKTHLVPQPGLQKLLCLSTQTTSLQGHSVSRLLICMTQLFSLPTGSCHAFTHFSTFD